MSDATPTPAPACRVVRPGDAYVGRQALTYAAGITGESVGARGICMVLATLPPGARAKAHLHVGIETAIHVLEGEAVTYFGPRLAEVAVARGGDFVHIPADLAHVVVNLGDVPCRALVAHTAPDDQQGLVLLPELDALV